MACIKICFIQRNGGMLLLKIGMVTAASKIIWINQHRIDVLCGGNEAISRSH